MNQLLPMKKAILLASLLVGVCIYEFKAYNEVAVVRHESGGQNRGRERKRANVWHIYYTLQPALSLNAY